SRNRSRGQHITISALFAERSDPSSTTKNLRNSCATRIDHASATTATATNSLPIRTVIRKQQIITNARILAKCKSRRKNKIGRERKTVTSKRILAHRKHGRSTRNRTTRQC